VRNAAMRSGEAGFAVEFARSVFAMIAVAGFAQNFP
jgi:hypothetical protein